jgi:hypothetical protein
MDNDDDVITKNIESLRRDRELLLEQIRRSRETIARSEELLKRIDEVLARSEPHKTQ